MTVNLYTSKTTKPFCFKGCKPKNPEAETGDSRDVEAATAEFLAPRGNRLDRGSRLRDDEPSQLGNFEGNYAQDNEREENLETVSGSHTQAGGFGFFLLQEGDTVGEEILCGWLWEPFSVGKLGLFFK